MDQPLDRKPPTWKIKRYCRTKSTWSIAMLNGVPSGVIEDISHRSVSWSVADVGAERVDGGASPNQKLK